MCCFYSLQQCLSGFEGSGYSRYIGKRFASLLERKEVFVEIITQAVPCVCVFVFLQYRKFWSFNWWVPLHSKFLHLLQTSCLLSLLPSSPVLHPSAPAVRFKPGSPQSDEPRRARGKDITYLALKTKKPLPQRWQENFGRMFVCQASVSSPNTDYTTTP